MKKLFCFFLFSFSFCYSQVNPEIDSLHRVMKLHKTNDTIKITMLYELGSLYFYKNLDTSIYYINKGLDLSKELKAPRLIGNGYYGLAGINLQRNQDSLAKFYYLKAQEVFETLNNSKGMALVYSGLSAILSKQGDYKTSIQFRYKQIKYAEEAKSPELIALAYMDLANDYKNMQDYNKGLEYMEKAIAIKETINDKVSLCIGYVNLGGSYHDNNQFRKAISYFNKALTLQQSIKQENILSSIYQGFCNSHLELGEFEKALYYLTKNESLCSDKNDELCLLNTYISYSALYDRTKKYNLAETYLLKAQTLAKKLNYIYYDTFINEALYKVYLNTGKHKEALEYYTLYINETMKQNDLKLKEQINTLEIKHQTLKKEEANRQLKETTKSQKEKIEQSMYIILSVSVFSILIISLLALIIRQNKLKSQQKSMEAEQKLLRSQMNPHFIFNSLIAIESFIHTKQPDEAREYLSDFAQLMRLILENSREEAVTLQKEIDTLKFYLRLQKLTLEDSFTYQIEVADSIDQEETKLPPMLIQPFIENAIKHGIANKENGHVHINIKNENNSLIIEVTDNGEGIFTKEISASHTSLATTITKERLTNINHRKKSKITFSIQSLPLKGTSVIFSFPTT